MPTYPCSRQYMYYTGMDNFSLVKLLVENKGRTCHDDYGFQ